MIQKNCSKNIFNFFNSTECELRVRRERERQIGDIFNFPKAEFNGGRANMQQHVYETRMTSYCAVSLNVGIVCDDDDDASFHIIFSDSLQKN
jgi:hypothetical protein